MPQTASDRNEKLSPKNSTRLKHPRFSHKNNKCHDNATGTQEVVSPCEMLIVVALLQQKFAGRTRRPGASSRGVGQQERPPWRHKVAFQHLWRHLAGLQKKTAACPAAHQEGRQEKSSGTSCHYGSGKLMLECAAATSNATDKPWIQLRL